MFNCDSWQDVVEMHIDLSHIMCVRQDYVRAIMYLSVLPAPSVVDWKQAENAAQCQPHNTPSVDQ